MTSASPLAFPEPTEPDIAALVAIRRELHAAPELSGSEGHTAARIAGLLEKTAPDRMLVDLGGHGVAAIYGRPDAGQTLLLRCELDALPIREASGVPYRSRVEGRGHLCGHDGHMAIMLGVAGLLGRTSPGAVRVVLLFQPAEETGAGAAAVLKDARFAGIEPDMAVSFHNLPGHPLGRVALAAGAVNCASRGVRLRFEGRTAHASQPETGVTPAPTLAALLGELPAMGRGTFGTEEDFRMITVTHAAMGAPSFGVAPGSAELWGTLRTLDDRAMAGLCADVEARASELAGRDRLHLGISYHDIFPAAVNHPDVVRLLDAGLARRGVPVGTVGARQRWSEDFGRFGAVAPAAMFFLGAGETCAPLHDPAYDFPDALIPLGISALCGAMESFSGAA